MRKKLATRFTAPRRKKIMQADEDVGKIAMAVPLLVSKALELFLQDLCNWTYEVTLEKGAKTDIVSRVSDLGGADATAEDTLLLKEAAADAADSETTCEKDADKSVLKFDLNVQLNVGDSILCDSTRMPSPHRIHDDLPGWALSAAERMSTDSFNLSI